MEFRVACATNDGKELIDSHFGEARSYLIYDVTNAEYEKVDRINNSFREEEDEDDEHGDPQKAKNIKELLKDKGVQVLLSRKFGPNIVHVRKNFVPVIAKEYLLRDAVEVLKESLDLVKHQWVNEEERKHIVLDGNNYHRS